MDNLQVTTKNIHVQYVDAISAPGHPFAPRRVTLEEFSAISTDGEWKPTFIQDSTKTTHKLATLEAPGRLLEHRHRAARPGRGSTPRRGDDAAHDELVGKFKSMIGKTEAEAVVGHQFILPARDRAGQDRARQDPALQPCPGSRGPSCSMKSAWSWTMTSTGTR